MHCTSWHRIAQWKYATWLTIAITGSLWWLKFGVSCVLEGCAPAHLWLDSKNDPHSLTMWFAKVIFPHQTNIPSQTFKWKESWDGSQYELCKLAYWKRRTSMSLEEVTSIRLPCATAFRPQWHGSAQAVRVRLVTFDAPLLLLQMHRSAGRL